MRATRIAGAVLLAGTVTGLAAGPAQAQEYRYWSFWDGKGGSWTYATEGPATQRPADGAVEGFRFTVGADSAAAGKPRTAAGFDAICGDTPAKEGRKRIGIVLDFGTAADAPGGERPPKARTECAQVSEDASAGEALAAVARPLRYDANALLCGIAGYPKAGCAESVNGSEEGSKDGSESKGSGADAAPSSGAAEGRADGGDGSGDGGPSAGLLGGVAAVVVLGAAAAWQARRRRG
ncbi:SCO2322 family protein [Streptomyces tubercidicus]|uniref:SCO2322 family protein n=1 Tax=Streptomyces tubercidicus TaxID=47759 RepID=UPI002E0DA7EA|nr:SCO2322 family protein [Streptomyces tubercidicus]